MRMTGILAVLLVLVGMQSLGYQEAGLMEVSPAEREAVQGIGQNAAQILMTTLKEQLTGAMRKGGPAYAVDFCNEKALDLTAEASASLQGLDLKRTTLKPRNPRNAPDALEARALHEYESAEKGNHPAYLVQKFEKGGQASYRYYQPVYTASFCLACHGEKIPSEVREILAARYPADQAVGYKDGEFRGLIRVEIPQGRLPSKP